MDDEFDSLPRWAVIAYAARCGRFVQPLIREWWKDLPRNEEWGISHLIDRVELAASSRFGLVCDGKPWGDEAAYEFVAVALRDRKAPNPTAEAALRTIYHAGSAWNSIISKSIHAHDDRGFVEHLIRSARSSCRQARDAARAAAPHASKQLDADLAHLRNQAIQGAWDDDTPVSSAVWR